MIRIPSLATLALLVGCTSSQTTGEQLLFDASGEVIEGQFVISHDLNDREMEHLGIEQLDYHSAIGAGLYEATAEGVSLSALRRALDQKSRGEGYVEANRPVHAMAVDDPYRPYQWNLDMLDAEAAWTMGTGTGVVVAVLDTGVYTGGEDTPVRMLRGYDFADGDSNPHDDVGHGTHVAGTIAQATDNGRGVAGLAPDATILPVRVLGTYGGDAYSVASGITYAVDEGADVINMSLGGSYYTSVLEDAVDYATSRGVIVVAASGNEGSSSVGYPASFEGVIAVGAVGADATIAAYSNGGRGLDVVAPGGDMGADANGDGYADGILQETLEYGRVGYQFYEGTSMAAPHVSAVAALLLSAGAEPSRVDDIILGTAKDMGGSGWDTWSGYGLIDPVAALGYVMGSGHEDPGHEYEAPADTTSPIISGVGGERSGASLTLWWSTDEPATSEIEFEGYGRFGDVDSLVTDHELRFTIDSSETYHFQLVAEDASGNVAVSDTWVTRP